MFIATGQGHGWASARPGASYRWGRNTNSQLGQGFTHPQQIRAPVQVGGDTDWVEVGCSQSTTCARKRNGSLWCWGEQPSGALAAGDATPRPTPAQVPTYSDWSAATVGTFQTCGLRPGGEIGARAATRKGRSAAPISSTLPEHAARRPDQRLGGSARRPFFTCARKADDSVWCMGNNDRGRAGRRSGDAGSQRDDGPRPGAVRRKLEIGHRSATLLGMKKLGWIGIVWLVGCGGGSFQRFDPELSAEVRRDAVREELPVLRRQRADGQDAVRSA